jgi:hypothetical protein
MREIVKLLNQRNERGSLFAGVCEPEIAIAG